VFIVRLLSATRQKKKRKEGMKEKMTFNSKQQQQSSSSSSSSLLMPGNRGIIHFLVFCFLQARRLDTGRHRQRTTLYVVSCMEGP
jgi:hypothetical protein